MSDGLCLDGYGQAFVDQKLRKVRQDPTIQAVKPARLFNFAWRVNALQFLRKLWWESPIAKLTEALVEFCATAGKGIRLFCGRDIATHISKPRVMIDELGSLSDVHVDLLMPP